MTPDDKSTMLEFLGWKSSPDLGVTHYWSDPFTGLFLLEEIQLDENLLAQALAKLDKKQRKAYWYGASDRYDQWREKPLADPCFSEWYIFDCPLSTKSEVVAGVIRNSNKGETK